VARRSVAGDYGKDEPKRKPSYKSAQDYKHAPINSQPPHNIQNKQFFPARQDRVISNDLLPRRVGWLENRDNCAGL
jgi:hypothetical protein